MGQEPGFWPFFCFIFVPLSSQYHRDCSTAQQGDGQTGAAVAVWGGGVLVLVSELGSFWSLSMGRRALVDRKSQEKPLWRSCLFFTDSATLTVGLFFDSLNSEKTETAASKTHVQLQACFHAVSFL